MEQKNLAVQQVLRILPGRLQPFEKGLSKEEWTQVEELRLRVGYPMTAVLPEGELCLGGEAITPRDLERLVEIASCASIHAVLPQLQEGFLTIEGGHRIGLCGTVVLEGERIKMLRDLSSASIRVARQFPGIGQMVAASLMENGWLQSTLILAPPGGGKTSLLRDLIRTVSNGEAGRTMRVGVVDQRGELGAAYRGQAQLDLGRHTDLLSGSPKAAGLMLLLRAMNPQVLAVDEVTAPEDVHALLTAGGCGVSLLATVHGTDRTDLERRKLYRELMEAGIFRRLVTIQGRGSRRKYQVEVLQ